MYAGGAGRRGARRGGSRRRGGRGVAVPSSGEATTAKLPEPVSEAGEISGGPEENVEDTEENVVTKGGNCGPNQVKVLGPIVGATRNVARFGRPALSPTPTAAGGGCCGSGQARCYPHVANARAARAVAAP
eukprot:365125-Chlamydomonas_euryale.AAC.15